MPYQPPRQFDGRVAWKDYLSPIRSQGRCGNCWAYATTGMLADRFCLQSGGQVKPRLSATMVTLCEYDIPSNILLRYPTIEAANKAMARDYARKIRKMGGYPSCFGNSLYNAARFLYRYGATTNECIMKGFRQKFKNLQQFSSVDDIPFCEDVIGDDMVHCVDGKTAARFYSASAYYTIAGAPQDEGHVANMMFDLYQWGPMAVGFDLYEDFLHYTGQGVYVYDGKSKRVGGHAVKLVGWGEEPDPRTGHIIPYWICANSWGKDWGDNGYFKIKRGTCNIERNIAAVIPNLPQVALTQYSTVYVALNLEDQRIRDFFNVNVDTGYPFHALQKIATGELKSDTGRIMMSLRHLPDIKNFTAGKLPITRPTYPPPPKIDLKPYIVVRRHIGVVIIAILISVVSGAFIILKATHPKNLHIHYSLYIALGILTFLLIIMVIFGL